MNQKSAQRRKSVAAPHSPQKNSELESTILYQRMGHATYAFTVVDGEVYFGQVPEALMLRSPEAPTGAVSAYASLEPAPQGETNTPSQAASKRRSTQKPKDLEAA